MQAPSELPLRPNPIVTRRARPGPTFLLLVVALTGAGAGSANTSDAPAAAPSDAAAALPAAAPVSEAMARSVRTFAERVVLPAHEALAAATARLTDAAATFERAPDAAALEALRRERLRSDVFRLRGRAFAFGPIHSLGLDAALTSPIDETGIDLTVASIGDARVADLVERRLVPSLTGLDAMGYLLGATDDPADFTPATRRYVHALARRIESAARELLAVWRDGHDGHPAFAAALATAGRADNLAYLSVESAAEEILRGVVDTVDVIVDEELPELAARADSLASTSGATSLAALAASLGSVEAAYRGADIEGWLVAGDAAAAAIAVGRALDDALTAAEAAVASASDAGEARAALARVASALERVRAPLGSDALPLVRPAERSDP